MTFWHLEPVFEEIQHITKSQSFLLNLMRLRMSTWDFLLEI